jgi:hypothetical protein
MRGPSLLHWASEGEERCTWSGFRLGSKPSGEGRWRSEVGDDRWGPPIGGGDWEGRTQWAPHHVIHSHRATSTFGAG